MHNPTAAIEGVEHQQDPMERVLSPLCLMDYMGNAYHVFLHCVDEGVQIRATQHVAQAAWDTFGNYGIRCRGRHYNPPADLWEFFAECSENMAAMVLQEAVDAIGEGYVAANY